jgi:DNA-directed RNA polymerase specialized sigma54-like protein
MKNCDTTVQVPPPVDLTIRVEIWKPQVRRQVIALLSLARRDFIQVIRQALTDNPMLEEVAPAEDEDTPAGEAHAPRLTAAADDLMDVEERYDILYTALDKTFFFDLSEPEWGSPMTETAWNV